jgi:hypothetical protein
MARAIGAGIEAKDFADNPSFAALRRDIRFQKLVRRP